MRPRCAATSILADVDFDRLSCLLGLSVADVDLFVYAPTRRRSLSCILKRRTTMRHAEELKLYAVDASTAIATSHARMFLQGRTGKFITY